MTEQECQKQIRSFLDAGQAKQAVLCYQEFVKQSQSEDSVERLETLALVEEALRRLQITDAPQTSTTKRRFNFAAAIRLVGVCTLLIVALYCSAPLLRRQSKPFISRQQMSAERDFALMEANKLYQSAHYAEALERDQRAYQLCMQLKERAGAACSLAQAGQAAVALGELPEARRLYEQALALRRETGPPLSVAYVLYSLGSLLSELGEYGQSRLSLEESLQLRLAAQDSMGVLECQRGLGRLASNERRYSLAKEWFYKAYSGAQRENKPEMEMALKAQLGMVACLEGDGATARKWVTEGLEYWQARKHPTWIAEMECDLSQIALVEGKVQEAEDRAERSLNLYRQVADQQGIAQASFALANALTKRGHYDSARDHYRKSLIYANEKGLRLFQKQISETLRLMEERASKGR